MLAPCNVAEDEVSAYMFEYGDVSVVADCQRARLIINAENGRGLRGRHANHIAQGHAERQHL